MFVSLFTFSVFFVVVVKKCRNYLDSLRNQGCGHLKLILRAAKSNFYPWGLGRVVGKPGSLDAPETVLNKISVFLYVYVYILCVNIIVI